MIVNKITHGFVIQNFDEKTGLCVGQMFIAGDDVAWANPIGEPVDPPANETYQPFDMVQPDDGK